MRGTCHDASYEIVTSLLGQGGGWCRNDRTCRFRKHTPRGSSNYMAKQVPFTGILSNKPEENPGFSRP